MTITVYSKPRCVQCDATYRALDKHGVAYETVDVSVDQDALAYIVGLGYSQAPVVIVGDSHWSGFRPDRINAVVTQPELNQAFNCGLSALLLHFQPPETQKPALGGFIN